MRIKPDNTGIEIRAFARTQAEVGARVEAVMRLFLALFEEWGSVRQVVVMIPMNPAYPWFCDCGMLRPRLLEAMRDYPWEKRVRVVAAYRGDPWGVHLNQGMDTLRRGGCDWGVSIAPEMAGLWNKELFQDAQDASREGAHIIGVRTGLYPELEEAGIVSNALAFWDLGKLPESPGFIPANHRLIAPKILETFGDYHPVGGEEAITSALLAEQSARIAFIDGNGAAQRGRPEMNATKVARNFAAIRAAGLDPRRIRAAVMA